MSHLTSKGGVKQSVWFVEWFKRFVVHFKSFQRFKRFQALLPRFNLRRGTLENPFVPPQLLLVTNFGVMVRLSACGDLGLHVRLI